MSWQVELVNPKANLRMMQVFYNKIYKASCFEAAAFVILGIVWSLASKMQDALCLSRTSTAETMLCNLVVKMSLSHCTSADV